MPRIATINRIEEAIFEETIKGQEEIEDENCIV
jgi:hypothetical protein